MAEDCLMHLCVLHRIMFTSFFLIIQFQLIGIHNNVTEVPVQ